MVNKPHLPHNPMPFVIVFSLLPPILSLFLLVWGLPLHARTHTNHDNRIIEKAIRGNREKNRRKNERNIGKWGRCEREKRKEKIEDEREKKI